MSEDKRLKLTKTLSSLNTEDKAWAINLLVQLLAMQAPSNKRKVRKPHHDDFTEAQWEEYFGNMTTTEIASTSDVNSSLLHNTAGKSIKPIEKWL